MCYHRDPGDSSDTRLGSRTLCLHTAPCPCAMLLNRLPDYEPSGNAQLVDWLAKHPRHHLGSVHGDRQLRRPHPKPRGGGSGLCCPRRRQRPEGSVWLSREGVVRRAVGTRPAWVVRVAGWVLAAGPKVRAQRLRSTDEQSLRSLARRARLAADAGVERSPSGSSM